MSVRGPLVTVSDGPPVACDPRLRQTLREQAGELGVSATDLASGAGHDAAFMTRICPAAMLFVPCRKGKSHAPEEWADCEAHRGRRRGACFRRSRRLTGPCHTGPEQKRRAQWGVF